MFFRILRRLFHRESTPVKMQPVPLRIEPLEERKMLAGMPVFLGNLNPTGNSLPTEFVDVGGTAFFSANDGSNGNELWKSDGTASGTMLVKDIRSGIGSSNPTSLTNVNGTLFFSANDGTNGIELWKSDGTSSGTMLVKDINSGVGASSPTYLANVNGTLFFSAIDATNGRELWKSDGTPSGTVLVKDINSGGTGSNPSRLTNMNGTLFFRANDGFSGYELWKSNGTASGTMLVLDINAGGSSLPLYLTNVNGTLFFTADNGGVGGVGRELWKSDGMSSGTMLVKDISTASSSPSNFTNVNGTLFFSADDGTNGRELWKSNGTSSGTMLVKDIRSGVSSSLPQELENVNGTLFFSANDGTSGYELWKSDGSSGGTMLIKDIHSIGSSDLSGLTNVNGTLFFAADDGSNGYELWKSDGTGSGTMLVQDLNSAGGGSRPEQLANVNGTLFFSADDGTNGEEPWALSYKGQIHGQKFHDTNGNRMKDPGEVGLDGWLIHLFDANGKILDTQMTHSMDVDGNMSIDPETETGLYWFTNVPPGEVTIGEELQTNWVPTIPYTMFGNEILPGFDLFVTDTATTYADIDFDGPGGNPPQMIPLQGIPINPGHLGGINPGQTDTIVRRLQGIDPLDIGGQGMVDIEIVALQLQSVAPVNIGGTDYILEVQAGSLFGINQPQGQMTVTRDHMYGGTFTATFPVIADIFLSEVGGPGFMQVPMGFGTSYTISSKWSTEAGPGDPRLVNSSLDALYPAGDFYAGIDHPLNCPGEKVLAVAQAPDANHGVRPVMRPEMIGPNVYNFTIIAGDLHENIRFGNALKLDFGDAPDMPGAPVTGAPYPTLLEHDGARHVLSPLFLGDFIDPEFDGQPNPSATGDDTDGLNDDDGVELTSALIPGALATMTVTASGPGLLNAWIDWNGDGDWDDLDEQFFTDEPLVAGPNLLSTTLPATGATSKQTYVRFRFDSGGGLLPTGLANDGEVEDYAVRIGATPSDNIGVVRGADFFRDANGNGVYDPPPGGDLFSTFGLATDEFFIGDLDGNGTDDIGVTRSIGAGKAVYRDLNNNGVFDDGVDGYTFFGLATDELILGDWDGDGDDDIGVTRDVGGNLYFYRDLDGDGVFTLGIDGFSFFGLSTDESIVGDWNGDGIDDIGVTRDVAGAKAIYRDLNNDGLFTLGIDALTFFGLGTDGTIIGDFDGDDTDDIGVTRDVGGGLVFYRDLNSNGSFDFGIDGIGFFGLSTDVPIVGDWNGDGVSDIGVARNVGGSKVFFQDLNGNASYDDGIDAMSAFGISTDAPIIGKWTLPLSAAEGIAVNPVNEPPLTAKQLQPLVSAAIDLLRGAGLSASQLEQLQQVNVYVSDLSGARLGQATGNTITLDINAAGHGWFIDGTPFANEEFSLVGDSLIALGESAANGRMDLLTVVLHELGHVLDWDHDELGTLMNELLNAGARRLPQ